MNGEPEDRGDQSKQPLDSLMERVRNVQDLRPFELTRRDDGRFTYDLQKPPADLTPGEAREAADALEELADLVREAGG